MLWLKKSSNAPSWRRSGGISAGRRSRFSSAPGLFLKGMQDLGLPYKFIASGSGSVDLKAKIKESMLGRKRVYEVYPLSLREFVDFRTGYRDTDRLPEFFEPGNTS